MKAICGTCNRYGPCKLDRTATKGNPWRCISTRLCTKRAHG